MLIQQINANSTNFIHQKFIFLYQVVKFAKISSTKPIPLLIHRTIVPPEFCYLWHMLGIFCNINIFSVYLTQHENLVNNYVFRIASRGRRTTVAVHLPGQVLVRVGLSR